MSLRSKFTWLWEEVRIIRRRTIKSHVSFLYIYCTRSLVYIHVQRTRDDLKKSIRITNLMIILWGGYSVLHKVKSILQWACRQVPIFKTALCWVSTNCHVVLKWREIWSEVAISVRLWLGCSVFELQWEPLYCVLGENITFTMPLSNRKINRYQRNVRESCQYMLVE